MSVLKELMHYNQKFVAAEDYAQYATDKYPNKQLAILSCMDARMGELLPQALGLKNGDAKMIKNAGAVVTHQFGSVMRSLLVAIYNLGVKEILVIGHKDCGLQTMNSLDILRKARALGISQAALDTLNNAGIDLDTWLKGIDHIESSVHHSVTMIKKHPLIPKCVLVHGLIMHPSTGKIALLHDEQVLSPQSVLQAHLSL